MNKGLLRGLTNNSLYPTRPVGLASSWSSTAEGLFLPGTILASSVYAPSSLDTWTPATTTIAVNSFSTGGLAATLVFTVPPNGVVDVEVTISGVVTNGSGASGAVIYLALFNHTGGALIGNVIPAFINGGSASTSIQQTVLVRFHLSALTPGPLQVDLASARTSASGQAASLYALGNTSKTVASDNAAGPLLMQAIASV